MTTCGRSVRRKSRSHNVDGSSPPDLTVPGHIRVTRGSLRFPRPGRKHKSHVSTVSMGGVGEGMQRDRESSNTCHWGDRGVDMVTQTLSLFRSFFSFSFGTGHNSYSVTHQTESGCHHGKHEAAIRYPQPRGYDACCR